MGYLGLYLFSSSSFKYFSFIVKLHVSKTLIVIKTTLGLLDGPAASSTTKTTNSSIHKSSQPVPKALSSQSSSMNLDSTSPSTPPKGIFLCLQIVSNDHGGF